MREIVGPARNLLSKRRRNAQQDAKTQWSLLVYFIFEGKRAYLETWLVYDFFC